MENAGSRHPKPWPNPWRKPRPGWRTPRWLEAGWRPQLLLSAMVAMSGLVAAGGAIGVAGATATPRPAAATATMSHSRLLSYPIEQVWPAALRYLRVDRGFALVDRDKEAGYILFDIPLSGAEDKTGRGSLEMIATTDASGRPSVSVQISTDAGPSYLPHAIGEGLASKLKSERGQPAPPPTETKPDAEPPDDSDDGGDPPLMPPAVDPSEL